MTKSFKASQLSQLSHSMWDQLGKQTQKFRPTKKLKVGYHTPSKEESQLLVAQLKMKALKLKKDAAYAKMQSLFA